ncbi:hypothetical protein PR048_018221 [Dryococelus australis]|uniref:Uncharacterized protein n=1 Tax=Dryococelus australis TaxID=614101 RepID=A0ABQ9HBU7_9NEOP|nr:hypothetical protein PR048_018221 [Dryococelus australis]
MWAKKWLLERKKFTRTVLLKELQSNDFFTILCNLRVAKKRLIVTLRFYATERTYEDLKFSAVISPQLLSAIIQEPARQSIAA